MKGTACCASTTMGSQHSSSILHLHRKHASNLSLVAVFLVHINHSRLMAAGLFVRHEVVGQYDDNIAFLRQARRRPVERHLPLFSFDGIGGEALPVIDVEDMHL